LVIGGGAPNSTLIAGALAAFLAEGVEFDVISASGAGVLMGLLATAPRDAAPQDALMQWAEVGVADSIYKLFPVNYKVSKAGRRRRTTAMPCWRNGSRCRAWPPRPSPPCSINTSPTPRPSGMTGCI
jgi:Patatin-like phospholipase.